MQDSRLTAAVSLLRLGMGPEAALKHTEAFKAAATAVESYVHSCTHLRDISSGHESTGNDSAHKRAWLRSSDPVKKCLSSLQWRLVEGHAVLGKDRAREMWPEQPASLFFPETPRLASDKEPGTRRSVQDESDGDRSSPSLAQTQAEDVLLLANSQSQKLPDSHLPSHKTLGFVNALHNTEKCCEGRAKAAPQSQKPCEGTARTSKDEHNGPFQAQKLREGASLVAHNAPHVQVLQKALSSNRVVERAAAAARFLEHVDPQLVPQGANFLQKSMSAFMTFLSVVCFRRS
jgi:hypothetical protein